MWEENEIELEIERVIDKFAEENRLNKIGISFEDCEDNKPYRLLF